MNISEYIEACRRFDNHDERYMIDALVHGAVNEAVELWAEFKQDYPKREAVMAELGDVMWNLARLGDELRIDLADTECDSVVLFGNARDVVESLLLSASGLSAAMEKAHRRGSRDTLAESLENHIRSAWEDAQNVAWKSGWRTAEVMQANIDKLTARHAERGLQLREA